MSYFPLEYMVGFLKLLRDSPRIRIVTYADFPWGDDYASESAFPDEAKRWRAQADPSVAYVTIQHDVDSNPELAWSLLRQELEMGVATNVMVFNRRFDRQRYQETGEVACTEYPVDDDLLRRAQDAGFVVGYHQNAYERSGYDETKAKRIFEQDVATLRGRGFDIRFFSPHGGAYGPGRLNNHSLPVPQSLARDIRWVANTRGPWLTRAYSDGGISGKRLDPTGRDLRAFVRSWRPGGRYRVLLHPQYYRTPWTVSENLSGTSWYKGILQACGAGGTGWEGLDDG